MKINIKKFYPWIPIIGSPLTFFNIIFSDSDLNEIGLDKKYIYYISSIIQGIWWTLLVISILWDLWK